MPAQTLHALVVDDDRAVQRMLADALGTQGFAVTVERDGEWALKSFEMKDFDLVLLDLLLPAINGYEVARRIRELPKGKSVPIVMISGIYKNDLHKREALDRYGAAAFLEKPFKASRLFETLRKVLGDRYPDVPVSSVSQPLDIEVVERLADENAVEEIQLVERASRATATSVSAIRGDFERTPFPEVLAEIHRWQATGALLLRREKVKKIVYFRNGEPQFVKSNLLSECLGRVMVKERMLSESDCEESLRRMKTSGRQQGTVLIDMGVISPANLSYGLNLQLRAKLFDVFAWRSGEYQFSSKVALPSEAVNLEMPTGAILYEGIRRTYDEERLREVLGDLVGQYPIPSSDPLFALQDVGLGEEEHLLLEAADGTKSVKQLRALGLLSTLDTDRLIYAMSCAQLIELSDSPSRSKLQIRFHPPPLPQAEPAPAMPLGAPPPLPPSRPSLSVMKPAVPWDAEVTAPQKASAVASAAQAELPPISADDLVLSSNQAALLPEISGPHGTSEFDEPALRERLAGKLAAMRRMDFFEILGLSHQANDSEITQAYLRLARENHPDRLHGVVSAELRKLQSELYDLITSANATLSDPGERAAYLDQLKAGTSPKPELSEEAGRILSAESRFQRGEELLRKKDYAAAYEHFLEAVKMFGDEGDFHAYLGWSRFQMDPNNARVAKEALSSLSHAVKLNPKSDRTYLFTGHIYKAIGETKKAEAQFEKAIQANPACHEALQELSILSWAARLGGGKRR